MTDDDRDAQGPHDAPDGARQPDQPRQPAEPREPAEPRQPAERSGHEMLFGAPDDDPEPATDPDPDTDPDRRRSGLALPIIAVTVAVVTVVAACFVVFGDVLDSAGPPTAEPATTSATARPGAAQFGPSATPTPTPTPTPSGEPTPRAATAAPVDADLPAPSVASVPAGTVVTEGDVRSPLGSVAYHYRVVADGSNGYDVQYSGFTSTLPVPVSATLIDIAPSVGDGLTSYGVGSVLLGGPTSAPTSGGTTLGTSQPSYLGTIVTYSSAPSADGVPLEIGPDKVLAVQSVAWSIPPRETNIAPADSGPASLAAGTVTSTTDAGAPRRYLVSPNDTTDAVAARFGISVAALIYLNAGLQVLDDEQRLFEGTTLNLDPASV